MNKYCIFKVHYFPSLDLIIYAVSSAFIRFHEQILNFQSSLFFQFRCWMQVHFISLNNISRTNIEFSKFTIFLVKILDFKHFQALHKISQTNIEFSKFTIFPVRMLGSSLFHEQILYFQSSLFS